MSNSKYYRLQELVIDTFNLDAPVEIDKGALLLESTSKTVLLQLRLNVLDKFEEISSVSLDVYGITDAGEEVEGFSPFNYTYSDIYLQGSQSFGDRTPIILDPRIRKVKVEINKVVFRQGDVWRDPDGYFTPTTQKSISSIDAQLLPQIKRETKNFPEKSISRISNIPLQCEKYWLCTCGRPNSDKTAECHRCGLTKSLAFTLTENYLQQANDEYQKEQRLIELEVAKNAAEKEAKEAEKKKIRTKIIQKSILFIGGLIAIILLTIFVVLPALKYSKASNLLDDGLFNEAIYLFESLGDYRNSGEMLLEANYRKANHLLENGNFEEAVSIFSNIETYKESATLIKEARFQEASLLLSKKEFSEAKSIFLSLGDYKNSSDMIKEVVYQKAIDLFNEEEYSSAMTFFLDTSGYKDADSYLSNYYKLGKQDLLIGKFDEAIRIFIDLEGYEDSIELGKEAKYQKAARLFEAKKYSEASGIFASLGSYKESNQYWSEARYLLGIISLDTGRFKQAALIFKSLTNYKDSEQLASIASINRTNPIVIIDLLAQALSSKQTKSLATFIPSNGLIYTNFYEGGVEVTKDAFLEELLKKITSSTKCRGITQFDDSFTVWYLNWTPDWQMTEMCYDTCWKLTPTWYSNYAGFHFKKEAGYYQLRALILKDPYTYYKELGYDTAPLMSCSNYPTCLGAPQTRLAVGMKAMVCLTSANTQVVRWSPGRISQVMTSLYRGSIVKIIGGPTCSLEKWTWWQVTIPDGRTGWMTEGGDSESEYYLCPVK